MLQFFKAFANSKPPQQKKRHSPKTRIVSVLMERKRSARIAEIDDLTPAGYEQLAAEAKQNGTSEDSAKKLGLPSR